MNDVISAVLSFNLVVVLSLLILCLTSSVLASTITMSTTGL